MISLVTCGHTFGGVQHATFPDIVVPEFDGPTDTLSVAHVASTFVTSTTTCDIRTHRHAAPPNTFRDPLVVGMNDTTNSDARIFGSDGNATMASSAKSPELYASCVELTEAITPLPVKPTNLVLVLANDTVQFPGQVRAVVLEHDIGWDAHRESAPGRSHRRRTQPPAPRRGPWYSMLENGGPLSLGAAAGIKSMRFVVDGKLEDQGGIGFPVQDGVLFSTSTSIVGN
ncbi:hypothetical protein C8R44DRAFT_753005 [Mycena epipterygia]|nr:hypothetical protein C8R44DRAFT_753005 [Mycena epipterygia]